MKKAEIFKQKLERLSNELNELDEKQILREQLKRFVMRTLNVKDAHTVNSWVDTLSAFGFIERVTIDKRVSNSTVYQILT